MPTRQISQNPNKMKKKWKIGWGITAKCNMDCSFCYSKRARGNKAELPFLELCSFVDRNYKYIESINYGTGENTLSETWFKLLKYIKTTYNIPQALTTNGYLAEALKKRADFDEIINALDEVDVSLDFANKQRHNDFRKNPNAFTWATETIKICKQNNITTTIVIMGIDKTLDINNLREIFKIAKSNDCFIRINIFRPNSKQKIAPLNYSKLKNSLNWIFENHTVVSLADPLFSAICLRRKSKDFSGTGSLRILHSGDITPSTYLISNNFCSEHIRSANLRDIIFDENIFGNDMNPDDCSKCHVKHICNGGAIDRRIIWNGSLNTRDPYCPKENHDSFCSWDIKNNISFIKNTPSIHDGYLPTLIFKPK